MNISVFGKIGLIFKYIFSSFVTIELFIFSILVFVLLIVNLKKQYVFINLGFIAIFIGLLLGVFLSYSSYVSLCFRSLFKGIMKYIYFPSTIVYFFIILFVSIMLIYTIFSKRITKFKKVFNYVFFNLTYLLFLLFVTLSASNNIDLNNMKDLYLNNTILSLIQASNVIIFIWLVYTCFYHLYLYYKRRFD